MTTPPRVKIECVECRKLPEGDRPKVWRPTDVALHPRTPRCVTHKRALKKSSRVSSRITSVARVYGIDPEFYAALLQYQGGKCYICRRATDRSEGGSKSLAVDHDHSCCADTKSCGRCVRGLLCNTCNRIVIGRYGPEALMRAIDYHRDPPAPRLRKEMSR